MIKKCLICSIELQVKLHDVKRGRGKFCSLKCLGIAKTNKAQRVKLNCLTCKNIFTKPSYLKARKFCSRTCQFKGQIGKKLNKNTKIQKNCKNCDKIFVVYPNANQQKYCSQNCHYIQRKGRKLDKDSRYKIVCLNCRKQYLVFPNNIDSKFCSRKCYWNSTYFQELLRNQQASKIPTSLEKEMIALIKEYNLPYKYTGNRIFWIGYPPKNPDFICTNGEKKLIEVGNIYHHQEDYVEKRRSHFSKYGWTSYIFIGDKLEKDKVLNYLKGGD